MSNPKSFYNQADYSAGSGSRAPVIHKPDEVSASDLLPPPPYSPDPSRKSTDSNYGSTEQQHVGLLSHQSQPFSSPSQKKIPNWVAPNNPQQQSSSRQEPIPVMPNYEQRSNRRRANGDPGCCRKWCKYLFAAILIWLVLFMYSDKIGLTPPSHIPPRTMCSSDATSWEDIPPKIDFKNNVEVVIQGRVTNGVIKVTPIENRFEGTIYSDIQFTPSSLNEQMQFDVKDRDGTLVLTVNMPENLSNDDCIHLNMEIRLPYSADLVRIDATNVDVIVRPFIKDVASLDIQTKNGKVELYHWSGESIRLVTSNEDIKIGSLIAGNSIQIENSNAAIYLSENLEAKNRIDIKNSNGYIESFGKIIADDTIKIGTSNELVVLGNLAADDVFVENANQAVRIASIMSKVQINVKTSNAPIDLSVIGEKNNKVVLTTSSEPVNLHMTNEFEGRFIASTSNGKVTIEDDTDIEYQDNLDYIKRGYRKGSRGKGDLTVTSSNSDINIAFDI